MLAALAAISAKPAAAQLTVARSPAAPAPALGRVVGGTAATTFEVNASTGAVTRLAGGNAVRVSTTSVTAPTITISCGTGSCATTRVRVTVSAVASSGPSISQFTVTDLTGTTFDGGAPAPGSSLAFRLQPIGKNRSASFRVGLRVTVPSSPSSGSYTFGYTVNAALV